MTSPIAQIGVMSLLLLSACTPQWGMPEQGYGYPGPLAAHAPRLGAGRNYTYFPRYEAYFHHATEQFHYPNGETWVTAPKLPNAEMREVFRSPAVPFHFPEPPSQYHWMVKRAYPLSWTPAQGRFNEPHAWGHSGWDIDRR